MQSLYALVVRWSTTLVCWTAVVVAAVMIGVRQGPLYAYAAWAGVAFVLSVVGALLIRSQPMSTPTMAGRVGYQVVHFGFRASHGRLWVATMISWCVWLAVGTSAVWIAQGWPDNMRLAIGIAWCADALAMMYVWGLVLRNRPSPRASEMTGHPTRIPLTLAKLLGLLAAVLLVSAGMWFGVGTQGFKLAAVIIAAGPLTVVGLGYGGVLLLFATVGRNARWN